RLEVDVQHLVPVLGEIAHHHLPGLAAASCDRNPGHACTDSRAKPDQRSRLPPDPRRPRSNSSALGCCPTISSADCACSMISSLEGTSSSTCSGGGLSTPGSLVAGGTGSGASGSVDSASGASGSAQPV